MDTAGPLDETFTAELQKSPAQGGWTSAPRADAREPATLRRGVSRARYPTTVLAMTARRLGTLALASAVALAVAACGSESPTPSAHGGTQMSEPSSTISTLTPIPMPSIGPPPGEIVADLRQSSRDAALNRFQVWIGNGLDQEIDPTEISYVDRRFPDPIPGERLRANPAGSERGYPLALPPRPVCGAKATTGTVRMTYAGSNGETVELAVEDEADVVARYVATRCFELAVNAVATLTFADEVAVDREGEGSVGTLVLVATPSGRPGGVLTIDSVGGTPLLTPHGEPVWRPEVTVRSDGAVRRIELPMVPARCDDHVFMESGGATAFRVRMHLDGKPGELVVRMSPAGASEAIGFARDSCGLG